MNKFVISESGMFLIKYHFVFCPRYRRRIFKYDGVTERFKEMVREVCEKEGMELFSIECGEDYAHIHLSGLPNLSPYTIMRLIRTYTNTKIREEFEFLSKMPSVWTKDFLVETGETLDKGILEYYVETQKTRTN